MYHRFHAPLACRVREVIYVSGDTWNVNPIALRRVERLFCKNERAVIDLDLGAPGDSLALVPVAAILVASIRLHCLPAPLTLEYRGPNRIACDRSFAKGEEMGWFEHGSTIIVFGTKRFVIDSRLTRRRDDQNGRAAAARAAILTRRLAKIVTRIVHVPARV